MRAQNIFISLSILFSLTSVVAFPRSSFAAAPDYPLCTLGGYFTASGEKILSELARNITQTQHIFGDPICEAAWKNGYKAAENYSKTGKPQNQAEQFVLQQAAEFRTHVPDM